MLRPLTIKFLRAMIDFILKKAWKRTLSGKNFRETLSWAESSVSQNRNSHRLGAARRYVGRDGTSRYRGHERHNAQKDFRWREGRMCARNPGRVSCMISIRRLRRSFLPCLHSETNFVLLCKQGGTVELYASPLIKTGVRRFCFAPGGSTAKGKTNY